jgi:hypothetical protein
LAIRDSIGTTIRTLPIRRAGRAVQHHGVLGGQARAAASQGAMPRSGQPVRATISARPSSNRVKDRRGTC